MASAAGPASPRPRPSPAGWVIGVIPTGPKRTRRDWSKVTTLARKRQSLDLNPEQTQSSALYLLPPSYSGQTETETSPVPFPTGGLALSAATPRRPRGEGPIPRRKKTRLQEPPRDRWKKAARQAASERDPNAASGYHTRAREHAHAHMHTHARTHTCRCTYAYTRAGGGWRSFHPQLCIPPPAHSARLENLLGVRIIETEEVCVCAVSFIHSVNIY